MASTGKRQRRSVPSLRLGPGVGSSFPPEAGGIDGCVKDPQIMRSDWVRVQKLIDGVRVRESRNVAKGRGVLTEVYRRDWRIDAGRVDQVFQVWISPGEISAWHAHRLTRDRIFVSHGYVKVVLYDGRTRSKTFGRVNEFHFGSYRPGLVLIPPGVWHGIQNVSHEPSLVLNMVDRAYAYKDPDHWRLPLDTPGIPYRFEDPPKAGQ